MKQSLTNADWLERLRSPDAGTRDAAVAALRSILVRGLDSGLAKKYETTLQVDDVAQDALLKILASLDSFEHRSRFTTWAMTIAIRVGLSELRRKHFQNVSLDSQTEEPLKIDRMVVNSTPSDEIDKRQLLETLKELIASQLSQRQQLAMRGMLEGLPVEEIARRTNSNRNAVYKLIHDARTKLRDGFTHRGISTDDVRGILG